MKKIYLIISCMLFFQSFSTGGDWSQFGHDPQQTYCSDIAIPEDLEIKWQYDLESLFEDNYYGPFCQHTSPAIVEDRMYLLDSSQMLCMRIDTGKVLYTVPAYSVHPHTPAVVDHRVFIASGVNQFSCIDARTGLPFWQKELPNLDVVSPLVTEDTVYVTADHFSFHHCGVSPCCPATPQWFELVAMNIDNGEDLWQYSVDDDPVAVMMGVGFPIYADERLFFYMNYYEDETTSDPTPEKSGLICLDAHTGNLLWKWEGILPVPPVEIMGIDPFWMTYYEGKIYMAMMGRVVCVDVQTQILLWEYDNVSLWAFFCVGNDVVLVRGFSWIDCLDAEKGELLWEVPVTGLGLLAMTEQEVFVGSSDGSLYRIAIKSGEINDSYYVGGRLYSVVVGNSCVIVGTSEDRIYCLGPSQLDKFIACVVILMVTFLASVIFYKKRLLKKSP